MRVVIMSGIPGSGKDTYIQNHFHDRERVVCSADHYFQGENGSYNFNPSKLSEAHGQCLRDFIDVASDPNVSRGFDPIEMLIVNNTNTTALEIAPYYQIASAYGYKVELITILASVEDCAKRNIHGVGKEALDVMIKRLGMRVLPPFWKIQYTHVSDNLI